MLGLPTVQNTVILLDSFDCTYLKDSEKFMLCTFSKKMLQKSSLPTFMEPVHNAVHPTSQKIDFLVRTSRMAGVVSSLQGVELFWVSDMIVI